MLNSSNSSRSWWWRSKDGNVEESILMGRFFLRWGVRRGERGFGCLHALVDGNEW